MQICEETVVSGTLHTGWVGTTERCCVAHWVGRDYGKVLCTYYANTRVPGALPLRDVLVGKICCRKEILIK